MTREQVLLTSLVKSAGVQVEFIEPCSQNSVVFRLRGTDHHVTVRPVSDKFDITGFGRVAADKLWKALCELAERPWILRQIFA